MSDWRHKEKGEGEEGKREGESIVHCVVNDSELGTSDEGYVRQCSYYYSKFSVNLK